MHAFLRHRLVGVFLAMAFGLGGIAGAFAQKMATVDDIAVVQTMAMGATPADICGKNGKALFADVSAKAVHAAAGALLPTHRPPLARITLQAQRPALSAAQVRAWQPFDPGHASRAPPTALA